MTLRSALLATPQGTNVKVVDANEAVIKRGKALNVFFGTPDYGRTTVLGLKDNNGTLVIKIGCEKWQGVN